MKRLVKWVLLLVVMVVLYWSSVYQPSAVKIASGFFFFLGCYLMFNPNLIVKTKPQDLTQLHSEFQKLFNSFNNTKLSIEKRRVELLSEFRLRYFGIGILGCVFIFIICLFIYILTDYDSLIVLIAIFIFSAFFTLNESEESVFDKKIHFPFSRRERVKSDYFYRMLKSVELTSDVLEEKHNQMIEFSTSENETFSNKNNFNITMNQYHVVNNNDNRVLNNNFNTIIENKGGESKKKVSLKIESRFWKYYNLPSPDATSEEKIWHFMELLDTINKKHESLENRIIFKYLTEPDPNDAREITKIDFENPVIAGSQPVFFAGFMKFLLKEKIISGLILDISIRDSLLDTFIVRGTEKFKNFQPGRWKSLDRYVTYLSQYK